jgi:hypothetical protein
MAEHPDAGARFSFDPQRRKSCFFKERSTCIQVPQGQFLTRYFALGGIPGDEYPDEFSCFGQAAANKKNPHTEDRCQKYRIHSIRNWKFLGMNFYTTISVEIKSRILLIYINKIANKSQTLT